MFAEPPKFDNADYFFKKYNVIAELKCLVDDKNNDKHFQCRIDDIFKKNLVNSGIVVFGSPVISTDQLSSECTKEIAELFRKPIRGVMKKANKQIRETKSNMEMNDAHGLLILINNTNSAVDPSRVMWILNESFRRDSFRSINSVLFLTLDLKATHPNLQDEVIVWIESYRDKGNLCPQALFDCLRNAIYSYWERALGKKIIPFKPKKYEFIHEISNSNCSNTRCINLDTHIANKIELNK